MNIKKHLILFAFFCASINLCAQHIEFMGIKLGQPSTVIDRLLKERGFVKDHTSYKIVSYKGTFWKFKDPLITTYMEDNGIVSMITVSEFSSVSVYNDLVASLRKKYGNSSFKRVDNIYYHTWSVNGGEIEAVCSKRKDVQVSINYRDKTNLYYISKQKNKNRKINDDL